jgi:hypothetical protein
MKERCTSLRIKGFGAVTRSSPKKISFPVETLTRQVDAAMGTECIQSRYRVTSAGRGLLVKDETIDMDSPGIAARLFNLFAWTRFSGKILVTNLNT